MGGRTPVTKPKGDPMEAFLLVLLSLVALFLATEIVWNVVQIVRGGG